MPGQTVPSDEFSVAGCARVRDMCRCYSHTAQVIEKPAEFCKAQTTGLVAAPASGSLEHVLGVDHVKGDASAGDGEVLAFMRGREKLAASYR